MFLGYNTNGFAHHRLEDAIAVLADLGYRGIALTLDVHHLDPFAPDLPIRTASIRTLLERYRMSCAIETGARFLLDPFRKHQPTLISPLASERAIRLEFLEKCVRVAAELNASCVSFWSGSTVDDSPSSEVMGRLVDCCQRLAESAEKSNVLLAFEPEPGMFISKMEQFAELHRLVNHTSFGLTVDIGHLACNGELPISKILVEWKHVLWNIHLEDMRGGVHDHLAFGEGEVDFDDAFSGLRAANYDGGLYVELSRHSFDAVRTARQSATFLKRHL